MDSRPAAAVALAAFAALAVAMGIGRFAFTPILPMMQREGVLTLEQGGWLASANYAGYFAGALTAMFLRIAPSVAIRAALVAIGITTIAMGFEAHMPVWLFHRFVAGMASAWVLVFATAWAMERLAVLERPSLGGGVFAGVGAGIALAGLACLVLMQRGADSAAAWILMGAISIVVTALVWRSFPATTGVAHAAREPLRFRGGGFMRLTLCYGALGFGYIVPATFLPAMARESMPDPAVFGWTWPVFGAAAAVSTLAAAAIARSIGYRALWIAASLAMAVGVALPAVHSGVGSLLASGILVGGTFMVITMAGLQEARRVAGTRARELIAAMTCAFALGQIAGPLVVSLLAGRGFGYSFALAAAAITLVLSALALLPLRRPFTDT